jgi:hypothetical protein
MSSARTPGAGDAPVRPRHDVGSRLASAAGLAQAIRGHGGIENRVHSVRDVALQEVASRIRQNPGIFARLLSLALTLLRAKGETHISLATYDNALNIDRVFHYVGVLR